MSANGDAYGFFWNSQDGDRTYDADSFEKWLMRFFTGGVFKGDFTVSAAGGMSIAVDAGYANINGKALVTNATTLPIAASSPVSPRIDTVVIERNDNNREMSLKIVMGTPSINPSPVSPVRTSSVYQLVIAQIYVGMSVTAITENDITDTREDTDLCGSIICTMNNFLYGEEELESGVSELPSGTFYFQYD